LRSLLKLKGFTVKKIAMFLGVLSFSEIIFVSMSTLDQRQQNQDILRLEDVLKQQGYNQRQIKIWIQLRSIAKKEEQGIPLSNSEKALADLDDRQ
jgi:hypothetical protein